MKINKSAQDSQNISNTSDTAPKQEAQKATVGPNLQSRWDSFVSKEAEQGGAVDPNAIVQYVLRESYMQTTEDLRFYAEKVKYFNECKKDVREYLGKLRDDNKDFKSQIDSLKPGQRIDGNVMETLTAAIKESLKDSNEDKKYYLGKLQSLNDMATYFTQQQEKFAEASRNLSAKEKKDDDD